MNTKNRVEHYLKRLLENPDTWVRVTKIKRPWDKSGNLAERDSVVEGIRTSLGLMGIPFKQQEKTKFMVISQKTLDYQKEIADSILGIDQVREYSRMAIIKPEMFSTLAIPRQTGKTELAKQLIKFKSYTAFSDDKTDAAVLFKHRSPTTD